MLTFEEPLAVADKGYNKLDLSPPVFSCTPFEVVDEGSQNGTSNLTPSLVPLMEESEGAVLTGLLLPSVSPGVSLSVLMDGYIKLVLVVAPSGTPLKEVNVLDWDSQVCLFSTAFSCVSFETMVEGNSQLG